MARVFLEAKGKSKKHAARQLNRHIYEARQFGLFKDSKILYTVENDKVVASCTVHS